ncbi:hypothetical protein LXA43DRAFT_1063722 [Ganoderma leucocontextum]|nr:hypothetical protein LXA43DRAFT_1063722 [Ganoderma leucocontextum]
MRSTYPDPYVDYRATYDQIVDEQNAHAHNQLDEFERRARAPLIGAVPPLMETGFAATGQVPAPPVDYGPSVRFQNPLPTRSISDMRALNAQRNQLLPIYASGQPISILQSAAGQSMVAPISGAPVNPHLNGLLRRIIQNICHKVGQQMPPLPEGAKQPKVEMPEKYAGANDHQKFYRWLDDTHRLQYLRQHLMKEAADWYAQEVDHPSVAATPMFEDTICALHTRFVHSNTVAKATEDFAQCIYSHCGGIEKFAEELKWWAKEMIIHPNEYEMRVRLLSGLPKQMVYHMQVHRGISAEYCTWDTILEHAWQLEDAYRCVDNVFSQKTSVYGATPGPPNHSSPWPGHNSGHTTDHRDRSHSHSRGCSIECQPERRERDDRGCQSRPRDISKTRFPPCPLTPGPAAPKDNACFACGKIGHFKGDPQCPRSRDIGQSASAAHPKPQFHVQRVEPESTGRVDDNGDLRDGWGGLQYSDDAPPADSQSEPEGEDKGSEIIRAYAMRTLEQENVPTLRSMRVTVEDTEDPEIQAARSMPQLPQDYPCVLDEGTSESVHIHPMRTTKTGAPIEYRSTVCRRDSTATAQLDQDPNKQAVLCGMVEVAGSLAYTMFDSGSTTNGTTPEYSHIMRTSKIVLDDQVVLQLGCTGSRSKINFGTRAPVTFGPLKDINTYFDVVNLDRYDCVFGTPFMNQHGVILEFRNREIIIKGEHIPAFTYDEDVKFRANRRLLLSSEDEDNEPEPTPRKTPKTKQQSEQPKSRWRVYINYPDREYFGYSQVKCKLQETGPMPAIATHEFVMPHSSKGVQHDKYGCEDPLGVNDSMEREIAQYFSEVPEPENELQKKMGRYLKAGWWEMHPAAQAAPLLCVPKKNGKLQTVVRLNIGQPIDDSDLNL